jgi:hypothetical protein
VTVPHTNIATATANGLTKPKPHFYHLFPHIDAGMKRNHTMSCST